MHTHPVHSVYDGKINTASGEIIDLYAPHWESINIEDIAAGLSKVCRFGGQVSQFYSVAQHSVLVSQLAPKELRPYAILHDATEAYIGDVIKPLKVMIAAVYGEIEDRLHTAICDRFGFEPRAPEWDAVKVFDREALTFEHFWLQQGFPTDEAWERHFETFSKIRPELPSAALFCWDVKEAETKFKNMCGFYKIN